jgi:hypothetical protein
MSTRSGSRSKLRPKHAAGFAADTSLSPLFREVAVAVCQTSALPSKELYEAWAMASMVDIHFPAVTRVADLAAGHGLLGWLLVLIAQADGRSRSAVCVDVKMPVAADKLAAALRPLLRDEEVVHYVEGGLGGVAASPGLLLAAVHACGSLTDTVLDVATAGGASVAVMPCCHSLRKQVLPRVPGLTAEALAASAAAVGAGAAIDGARMEALRLAGYHVTSLSIDPLVTPFNHVILARAPAEDPARGPAPPAAGAVEASAEPAAKAAAVSPSTWSPPPPNSQSQPHSQHARKAAEHARKTAAAKPWQPARIPLADAEAVAAMAGRRAAVFARAMELSLWLPAGAPVDEAAIARIARRASSAAWRPRRQEQEEESGGAGAGAGARAGVVVDGGGGGSAGSAEQHACGGPRRFWAAEEAVAEAISGDAAAAQDEQGGSAQGVCREEQAPPAVTVRVQLRDVYLAPDGRRSCQFRVEFRRTGPSARAISKGELGMWQARVREALELWAMQSRSAATGTEERCLAAGGDHTCDELEYAGAVAAAGAGAGGAAGGTSFWLR